jgi:hypothetical protein
MEAPFALQDRSGIKNAAGTLPMRRDLATDRLAKRINTGAAQIGNRAARKTA